ncbi:DNA glycosylase [Chitinophaga sp. MM2321]|uniref:DNA-3-methyladenine glycosylase family protein n=1 Tax=Chitinophaga sp. MM2321 TaxID=3137178 RepID=UPI0032D5AE8D
MDKNLIRIPFDPSFNFRECLWFLNRNYDDCLHRVNDTYIEKALIIDQQPVLFRIDADSAHLIVTILEGPVTVAIKAAIRCYIAEWFDMDRDIKPFYKLLRQDKRLSYMAKDFAGLRLIGIPDLFEAICWCIIGQQINLVFAYKIKRRLAEKYGTKVIYGDTVHYIFPDSTVLQLATMEDLRAMQFSARKVEYLVTVAKAFSNGTLSKEMIRNLPDFSARQQALIRIKGIGIWTANYVLMKSLREPSGIPYGDAGLLNALIKHGIIRDKKEQAAMTLFFQQFVGWESYLAFYCWRSLAGSQAQVIHGKS